MIRVIVIFCLFLSSIAQAQDHTGPNAWPELERIDARSLTTTVLADLAVEAKKRRKARDKRGLAAELGALEAIQAQVLMPAADADFEPEIAPRAKRYRESCLVGNPHECFNLATLYQDGVGVWFDAELATTMYELACRREVYEACFSLVGLNDLGEYFDIPKILLVLKKACTEASAKACYAVGRASLFTIRRSEQDIADANDMFKRTVMLADKACARGDGSSCYLLHRLAQFTKIAAQASVQIENPKIDPEKRLKGLEAGCVLFDRYSCEILAKAYLKREPSTENTAEANRLFDLSCALGSYYSCRKRNAPVPRSLAYSACYSDATIEECRAVMPAPHPYIVSSLDEMNEVMAQNRKDQSVFDAAVTPEYFMFHPMFHGKLRRISRACAAGHSTACVTLADAYINEAGRFLEWGHFAGIGDRDTLRGIFEHMCEAGDLLGCRHFGDSYNGIGNRNRPDLFLPAWQRGCDGGDATSCARLSSQFLHSEYVGYDPDASKKLAIKACDMGYVNACYNIVSGNHSNPLLDARANLRGCLEGHAIGCRALARSYTSNKDGFRRNRAVTAMLRKIGCDIQTDNSCS